MADASRFPSLVLPFTIVGAAAGWLSVGLVQHPVLRPIAPAPRLLGAVFAALLGALVGGLLTSWCGGEPHRHDLAPHDPTARPPTDRWPRHVAAVLGAGVLTGAMVGSFAGGLGPWPGAYFGFLCALPFLPVTALVLAAARRARRARLGSLVAGCDRRAVWGILATLLAVATLEAAPDWVAPRAGALTGPMPALVLLGAATLCILWCLALDLLALRRATRAVATGLVAPEEGHSGALEEAPRLDLGLGDAVHARLARPAAAYRERARTLAIVEGDPDQALAALRRARRRGAIALGIVAVVALGHVAADSPTAHALYEWERCALGRGEACSSASRYTERSMGVASPDPRALAALYERGCDLGDGTSCLSLAGLHRGKAGLDPDFLLVAHYEYRAAQRGHCPPGTSLVTGSENVCVSPGDPRDVRRSSPRDIR